MGQNVSGHRLRTHGNNRNLLEGQQSLFDSKTERDSKPVMNHFQKNIDSVGEKYPLKNGKFGKNGKNCQVINTDEPQKTGKDFFDDLTDGMKIETLPENKGWIAQTEDGTVITYRPVTSTPNSPAIDINTKKSKDPPLKGQKIHFETEENEKKNEHRK